jgi:hypothetical protein
MTALWLGPAPNSESHRQPDPIARNPAMRSPNRTHERHSFFKYMSAATAHRVLTNRSLRWSSPILFNDPFDVPREISFGLTPDDIVDALALRMSDLIAHPPNDTGDLEQGVRLIVETVKSGIERPG